MRAGRRRWSFAMRAACCLIGMMHSSLHFFAARVEAAGTPVFAGVQRSALLAVQGGAATRASSSEDAYTILAEATQKQLADEGSSELPDLSKVVRALKSLSAAQKTFKGLDGAAHEAYQRTHSTDEGRDLLSVSGRAKRSAARTGAVADALGACELCEFIEYPNQFDLRSANGTLAGRQVLLNVTDVALLGSTRSNVCVLVLYEPLYRGGAGIHHGGIEDLTEVQQQRQNIQGRLVVIVCDGTHQHLDQKLRILEQSPKHVSLHHGPEVVSVQSSLYSAAGSLLRLLDPLIRSHEKAAVHFVGHSLSGGIAALAAIMLEGEIPLPAERKKKAEKKRRRVRKENIRLEPSESEEVAMNKTVVVDGNESLSVAPLQGLRKSKTSAVSLGAPPCVSANVPADFVTSILYGDDVICRTSPESFERFLARARRALKRGGIVGKRINFMQDALSLATSNLQSHAVGSEGEEARLAIPGKAYLVRPRRLGRHCSMHEIGAQLKGGREALRAAVLWQLNDILLSRSLWKHNQLDSYIHGLDRVHLRGLDESETD